MTTAKTCIWFDGRIEEAAEHYVAVVPGSEIHAISRYPDDASFPGGMGGQALVVDMAIAGHEVMLLNGGPQFPLSEVVSIALSVSGQDELDRLWDALVADGGRESRCGWLVDRFGLSWQVVPDAMGALMGGPHGAQVSAALMQMGRIDLAALERAAAGE